MLAAFSAAFYRCQRWPKRQAEFATREMDLKRRNGLGWLQVAAVACVGWMALAGAAKAQAGAQSAPGVRAVTQVDTRNWVGDVRTHQRWELGPVLNGGNGLYDRSSYHFVWAGVQAGKVLTPVVHAGPFSGQFELGAEILPYWQAFTPAPYSQTVMSNGKPVVENYGGGTFTGLSIEPVIFRWNFLTRSQRFQPWFQAAGGLIYTTHKFPPNLLVPHGTPGGTSVFNFTPQGGIGFHYFLRRQRSLDVGLNAVHISSASLGDKNPGVNSSLQLQIGYTWWK